MIASAVTFSIHLLTALSLCLALPAARGQESGDVSEATDRSSSASVHGGESEAVRPTDSAAPKAAGDRRLSTTGLSTTERIKALEDRISRLEEDRNATVPAPADEVTRLQLERQLPDPLQGSFSGLGPSLSKVYFADTPLVIGSFGEIFFASREGSDRFTNTARVNLLLGHRFSRSIIFNSAFSFQNGGSVPGSESATRVEFAYLDFLIGEASGVRVGNILIPFGLRNLKQEPMLFPTVNRHFTELALIPTTWHENGLLGFFEVNAFALQLGLVNSSVATLYQPETWIRNGRQGGSLAQADDLAGVIRVDWRDENNLIGLSFYSGDSAQGRDDLGDATVTIAGLYAQFERGPFTGQALYSEGWLSDTERILAATNQVLGSRVRGGTVVFSYDLLPHIAPIAQRVTASQPSPESRELPVYISYESSNLHADVPAGANKDAALKQSISSFGFNYKPHPQVVIKTGYSRIKNDRDDETRIFETGIGYAF